MPQITGTEFWFVIWKVSVRHLVTSATATPAPVAKSPFKTFPTDKVFVDGPEMTKLSKSSLIY